MSITPVLTVETHRALLDPLFNSAESDLGFLAGHLTNSVRIGADPDDLRAIGDASREMVDSAQPVMATVLGRSPARFRAARPPPTRRPADRWP